MDQDRIMKVTDENGNEVEMYILFTTRLEEYNKNYIFYTDPKDQEGQVFVSSYTEDNKLVNFKGDKSMIGQIVDVKIIKAKTYTLEGEQVGE